MKLTEFLEKSSAKHGAAFLEGAIVFTELDRPLDQIIRQGLALGPYHPGKPAPWSHCFLLAETYHGGATKILDCSIRDDKNQIIWDSTLEKDVEMLAKGLQGREGKIYSGEVSEYDHERLKNCGLYFLPKLTEQKRHEIVNVAKELQKKGYRYDLPGLVRELVRLFVGVTWEPGEDKLLFCSAFAATVYRTSLGIEWNVAPEISSADVTLDEIWYSKIGVRE